MNDQLYLIKVKTSVKHQVTMVTTLTTLISLKTLGTGHYFKGGEGWRK